MRSVCVLSVFVCVSVSRAWNGNEPRTRETISETRGTVALNLEQSRFTSLYLSLSLSLSLSLGASTSIVGYPREQLWVWDDSCVFARLFSGKQLAFVASIELSGTLNIPRSVVRSSRVVL